MTAKPSAAFPLARLVVGLMLMGHADSFGDVLAARLVKKSCWVVPFWPARKQVCPPPPPFPRTRLRVLNSLFDFQGQTDAEYNKQTGRLATPEPALGYTTRQTGILTLYFAILSTLPSPSLLPPLPASHPAYPPYAPNVVPTFFTLPSGWRWLSSIMKAQLWVWEGSPMFVVGFLDVCAGRMEGVYGRQMAKVLRCLRRQLDVPPDEPGKKRFGEDRLRLRLDDWVKAGKWVELEGSSVDP